MFVQLLFFSITHGLLFFFVCCYDGLNEDGPHRFICLNTHSLVGGTVWEELGGMTLLEDICQV